MQNPSSETGIVKVFYPLKGYGFITRPKGRDVFFHFTDIVADSRDGAILEGDKVKFVLTKADDGKVRAEMICRIG